MIKLLVVDDETTTRKGLIKHIPWNDLGVDFVEEARDGFDALEKADRFHPNIVLSDIRMPGIDGIELSVRLRKKFPNCRLIFISGYSDKEYLKAAINLSVVGYVEKPINPSEVIEVVKKAVALCTEEERKKLKEENINVVLSENLPFIKQKVALNLIEQKNDPDESLKDLSLLNIPFADNDRFNVMLIKLLFEKEQSSEEIQNSCNYLLNAVDECFADMKHISVCKDNSHVLVILSCSASEYRSRVIQGFERVKNVVFESGMPGIHLFCGASQSVFGMAQIPQAYQNAVLALQKLFYYGYDKILFFDKSNAEPLQLDGSIFDGFELYLAEQKEQDTVLVIEDLCNVIKEHDSTLVNHVKNIFFKLSLQLFRESEKRGVFFNEAGDNEEKYLWDLISNFITLQDIREYMINKITFVFKGIKKLESSNRTVFEVKKHIQKNFWDENLSAAALAEHVYLTPTYLSAMFKKVTGKTISEYIIKVRIEKSKEYLKDSQLKLFEVARNVGYNDANYYAKAFKKLVGLTPSEYREKYPS